MDADPVSAFEAVLGKGYAEAPPEAEQQAEPEAEKAPEVEAKTELPAVYRVAVDGKEIELTAEQVAEAYKSGLRQQDYTRKTMEVSETRKAAEAETSKARAEREAYATNLQRMQAQIEGALDQQKNIDWHALRESDPVKFLEQWHLQTERQAKLQQVQAESQRIAAMSQAEQDQARQRYLSEQQQDLLAKLPDWKDGAKATAEKAALREYLISEGYDAQTVDNVTDAKAVVMARKAMLYDRLMSKAKETAAAVTKLPPRMEKPGVARPTDGRTADMQALRKTGKAEDAAAIFAKLL